MCGTGDLRVIYGGDILLVKKKWYIYAIHNAYIGLNFGHTDIFNAYEIAVSSLQSNH